MQHRRIDRADLQLDRGWYRGIPRQAGCPVQPKTGMPISTEISPSSCSSALRMPATVWKVKSLLPGFGGQRLHHAAHAVAAGLRLRAVGVDDVDIGIGTGRAGIVDRHDLVEAGRRIGVQRNRGLRVTRSSRPRMSATMISLPSPFILAKAAALAMVFAKTLFRSALYGRKTCKLPVQPPPRQLRQGKDAQHEKQEQDQRDADQNAGTGCGGAGQCGHAEQACRGSDDKEDEEST